MATNSISASETQRLYPQQFAEIYDLRQQTRSNSMSREFDVSHLNASRQGTIHSALKAQVEALKAIRKTVEQTSEQKRDVYLQLGREEQDYQGHREVQSSTRAIARDRAALERTGFQLERRLAAIDALINSAEEPMKVLKPMRSVNPSWVCNKWTGAVLTLLTLGGLYFAKAYGVPA